MGNVLCRLFQFLLCTGSFPAFVRLLYSFFWKPLCWHERMCFCVSGRPAAAATSCSDGTFPGALRFIARCTGQRYVHAHEVCILLTIFWCTPFRCDPSLF